MKILSFLNYLLLIAVITIILGVIYATVQQSYRTGANDPQIQIAEDISTKIHEGKSIENIFKTDTIDIANSLSSFIAVYDSSGLPINSTGYLNGKMAQPPPGVFEFAKKNGGNRVTWQPKHDVRVAMVIAHLNSWPIQFVAAGRSLKEVEEREYNLRKTVFAAWLLCIGIILLRAGPGQYIKSKF